MGSSTGTFGPDTIKGTGIALIVLTSLVLGARFAGSIQRFSDLKAEDYFLLIGYLFFLTLSILYIYIAPVILRLAALGAGKIGPYATYLEDARELQVVFFVTTSAFWLCLWMIKFSLLAMYKRLLVGRNYIIAWWVIVGFCVLVSVPSLAVLPRTDMHFQSLSSPVLSRLGFHARASTPGLPQANATYHGTSAPPSSAYTSHTRPT